MPKIASCAGVNTRCAETEFVANTNRHWFEATLSVAWRDNPSDIDTALANITK
jgi:hypothetical protein